MRRVTVVALVSGIIAVASACGESRFEYEQVKEVGLYFKVPREWTVFDTTQFARDNDDPTSGEQTVRRLVIDSAQQADPAHVSDLQAPDIVGQIDVKIVGRESAESTSLTDIRTTLAGFGFDPVSPPTDVSSSGNYALLAEAPRALSDGSQGTLVAYNVVLDADGDGPIAPVPRQVIDVSYVNPLQRTAYLARFHCPTSCTEKQVGQAISILNSFTISRD